MTTPHSAQSPDAGTEPTPKRFTLEDWTTFGLIISWYALVASVEILCPGRINFHLAVCLGPFFILPGLWLYEKTGAAPHANR
nr:hypothetical protein 9 [Saccharospirillaceae bacterium]